MKGLGIGLRPSAWRWQGIRNESPNLLIPDNRGLIRTANTFHRRSGLLYQYVWLVKKSYLVSCVSQEFITNLCPAQGIS